MIFADPLFRRNLERMQASASATSSAALSLSSLTAPHPDRRFGLLDAGDFSGLAVGTAGTDGRRETPGAGLKAVVIGSGFGGLASAIRLQSLGFPTTLLEKQPRVGGRAYQYQEAGYTFDMGPSLVTAPSVLRDLFRAAGADLDARLPLLPLDPYYRVFFHDGSRFDYNGDPERMRAQMRAFHGPDADRYDAFYRAIQPFYEEVLEKGLGSQSFADPLTMVRFLPTVMRTGGWRNAASFVRRYFKDERHRFLFSFHPLYIGGHPFHSPALYLMIPFLERAQGVFYTRGGMYAVVESMRTLFEEKGGVVRTAEPARRIAVEDGRAVGVETEAGFYAADLVVSNADLAHTYSRLIEPSARRKYDDARLRRMRHTMSCFLMFLGVKGQLPKLAHHTLILGKRYRGLLDDIFGHRPLPEDFSLYLHAPTKTEAAMAPPGCESLMVLSPVSNLENGHDWEAPGAKEAYADRILTALERFGLKDLRKNLEVFKLFAPTDFREELWATRGNAFGLEPTLSQTGYFRPHNRSEDVEGLYFAGAGTHPGAGVPGVLLSAETVENCVREDLPRLRARAAAGAQPRAHAA